MTKKLTEGTPEINAIGTVYAALKVLDPSAQLRVLKYSAEMLGLTLEVPNSNIRSPNDSNGSEIEDASFVEPTTITSESQSFDDAEGINAVALKWVKRSGLSAKSLQTLFSLGIDEIDLVAKSVPGASKKERMRGVLLLKAIAAYLSTGAARVTYEQLKEASLHYNAYDAANFATNIKSLAPEVGGTKESGFTLTARGITSATELVKEMLAAKS